MLKTLIILFAITATELLIVVINQIKFVNFINKYKVFGTDNSKDYVFKIKMIFIPGIDPYKLLVPKDKATLKYYREKVLSNYFIDKINSEYPKETKFLSIDDDQAKTDSLKD